MTVRPSVQKNFLFWSMISGPIALVLSVLTLAAMLIFRPPSSVDTYRALTEYTRSEHFARNFLLLWLAGNKTQEARFKEMTSTDVRAALPPDPLTVTDINVTDVSRYTTDNPGEVEWAYTLSASILPPGGTLTRNFFRVVFVEVGGAFQAIALPRITSSGITPIKVGGGYPQQAALDGALGKVMANFAQAYLVSSNSAQLGRYASEKFTGKPIVNSPYTSVKVTDIQVGGDKDVTTTRAGDSLDIVVTVKGNISDSTYSMMQLPIRVTQTSNGQWLVDRFNEPLDFGEITAR